MRRWMWAGVGCVLATVLGCGGGDDDASPPGDDTSETGPSDGLRGCRDPATWSCEEPPDGFEFTCQATCEDRWVITCNQQAGVVGTCMVRAASATQGPECDVPLQPSGCAICEEALADDCAPLLEE